MKRTNENKDFRTPEGYFEGFTDKLMGRLSDGRSVPSRTESQDGFTVPDGYFENLSDKILSQIEQGQETKVVRLRPYRKYYLVAASMAAMLILALSIDWSPSKKIAFEGLSVSDLDAYFELNELGISALELAEVLPVDNLAMGDMMNNRLNDDNIMDYLQNHIDHIEDLNLQDDE